MSKNISAFIEVAKLSRNKYEWNEEEQCLELDRVLQSAVFYPQNYGFIPKTLCGDGDPLDVLVISNEPLIPGCKVFIEPLCYLEMTDEKGNSLWAKTEELWLDLYRNKKKVAGLSVMKKVNWKDEWLAEAYMETDYSNLKSSNFENTIRDYYSYIIKNGENNA